ncbi:MAG: Protein tyrosine/serine phosphatase [Labilithrix sp.]|nr:Protein tyrosine/serine phosphatase [Labilithrix sp.]
MTSWLTRAGGATLLCFGSFLAACAGDDGATAPDAVDEAPVTSAARPANFAQVKPGLYRGGRPDAASLDYLKSIGVKRIVNLEVGDFIEAAPWTITKELDLASARGLVEVRYPMSAFEPALSSRFDDNMDQLLALLATATPTDAIYVHCKHGQDRTGLVIGLERVEGETWSPAKAHQEMVDDGFHTAFLGLEEYFERRTHYDP